MTARTRFALAWAAIVAHLCVAAYIATTFTGSTLAVVITPWIASGIALGLTLARWIGRRRTTDAATGGGWLLFGALAVVMFGIGLVVEVLLG